MIPLQATLTLADIPGEAVPILAIGGGLIVAVVSIVSSAIRKSVVSRHREESRREIAAYIAEGSMTPEQGVALMNAGRKVGEESRCG